jgi:hypothetical protein
LLSIRAVDRTWQGSPPSGHGARSARAQRSAGTLGTILTVMLVASAAGMAIARYLT